MHLYIAESFNGFLAKSNIHGNEKGEGEGEEEERES